MVSFLFHLRPLRLCPHLDLHRPHPVHLSFHLEVPYPLAVSIPHHLHQVVPYSYHPFEEVNTLS